MKLTFDDWYDSASVQYPPSEVQRACAKAAWEAALAQQAQPEMPTREQITHAILQAWGEADEFDEQDHGLGEDAADAVLALYGKSEAKPMYCASCGEPYGHPEPCGA